MPNAAAKFFRTPGKMTAARPHKGKHNEVVYSEISGMDPAEHARLHEEGII